MVSPVNPQFGSPASNITWSSLDSAPSNSTHSHQSAGSPADISWESLDSVTSPLGANQLSSSGASEMQNSPSQSLPPPASQVPPVSHHTVPQGSISTPSPSPRHPLEKYLRKMKSLSDLSILWPPRTNQAPKPQLEPQTCEKSDRQPQVSQPSQPPPPSQVSPFLRQAVSHRSVGTQSAFDSPSPPFENYLREWSASLSPSMPRLPSFKPPKHQLEPQAPERPHKQLRTSQPSQPGPSKVPTSTLPLTTPETSPNYLEPETPTRTRAEGNKEATTPSSTRSSRQAKPPPGSPVWHHLRSIQASRQNTPLRASHEPTQLSTPAPMGNSTPRRGLSSASNQDDEDIVQLDDWGFPEIMDEGDDDDGADDMEGSAEDNVEDDMEDRWDNNDDEGNQEPINDTDNATGSITLAEGTANIEIVDERDWYINASEDITYRYTTPTNYSASSTPNSRTTPPATVTNNGVTENQKQIIQEIQTQLFSQIGATHTKRVSYWRQLKASNPSHDCVTTITLHLWLSSLLAGKSPNTLYIDPMLAEILVTSFKSSPADLASEDLVTLGLLDRHRLWPIIGETMHILVLTVPKDLLGHGIHRLVLMDMTVEKGQVKKMDVLLPPFEAFDSDLFSELCTSLVGALNCILPEPKLIQRSSKVPQKLRTFVLPQPHTLESDVLVLLAHFCGKLLDQDVKSVDIGVFRQSLAYYYDHALRSYKVDASFPWVALTDSDGNLLTVKNSDTVRKRRFSLAVNREPSPHEHFPRTQSHTTGIATPDSSAPFFIELAQPKTSHPEGILVGTTGRSIEAFEMGCLLGHYPSWRRSFPDQRLQIPEALSIQDFIDLIHSMGGPESHASQQLVLTMMHNGRCITVDWLRDIYEPDLESLLASWDVDSLTATFTDVPELLEAGNYYPYPNRDLSLKHRNELKVRYEGNDIDMHSCPNICIMTLGPNSQFRLLVLFPGKRDKRNRLWRNIPTEEEMEDWFHLFLTALEFVSQDVPEEWQHAVEKTIEALPRSYQMSKNLCSAAGQARSFITRRIEPEIMNRAFRVMRHLVDTTPKYALYRGYFFHLCGINLKLATQHIPGRQDQTPLNHAFQIYRFINFHEVNPNDIVVDIGLATNLHRDSAPEELRRSTLLIRYDPLRELLRPGYRQPQKDSYCHSHVIAGLRAIPRASTQDGGIIKIQAYHKCYLTTYKDRDRSIGANFTVDEALGLGHRGKFDSQMKAFQENQEQAGSYGLRLETRLTAWAANRLMQTNPRDILARLVQAEVIVCHPTETVAGFKLALSKTWCAIIKRQAALPLLSRKSPEVMLLTSALVYFLKGLVKRPDEMSSSQEMAERLALVNGARDHGLPFLRSRLLDNDGLRVAFNVEAHTFKILFHTNVIIPGGQRTKSKSTGSALRRPVLLSPPRTPAPPPNNNNSLPVWSNDSEQFLQKLLKIDLPRIIWSYFPEDRKASGKKANELRTKPLKRSHWSLVVEPLNIQLPVNGKFMQSFDRLFPPDWKLDSATGDFKKYNRDFLCRIRDHVDSFPPATRSEYSAELRRRIRTLFLASYDYLPVMHAHKMWVANLGVNGQRMFRISCQSS